MPQSETPLTAPEPSTFKRITPALIGGVIAAMAGLAVVIIVGMLAFDAVVGLNGVIIAGIVGALLGGALRGFGKWPARSIAGAVGGAVGGFFAVAAAELSPPGSVGWALHGSLIGTVFAAPVAAITAGVIAALFRPRTYNGRV